MVGGSPTVEEAQEVRPHAPHPRLIQMKLSHRDEETIKEQLKRVREQAEDL